MSAPSGAYGCCSLTFSSLYGADTPALGCCAEPFAQGPCVPWLVLASKIIIYFVVPFIYVHAAHLVQRLLWAAYRLKPKTPVVQGLYKA